MFLVEKNPIEKFLEDYTGLAIIILFAIVLIIYYVVKGILDKYKLPEKPQTPEEIQKEYMSTITVTEEYVPTPKKKKKKVEEEVIEEKVEVSQEEPKEEDFKAIVEPLDDDLGE
ncbi:MAG: hypothetical protein LBM99_05210 [Bacillales bacterium]|jgi:nucleoside recognition membrane protein YjiH|nr:hypothetical protein [Bacillales bacterium]